VLPERDLRLTSIGYVFGSRANHFNPVGVFVAYSDETRRMTAGGHSQFALTIGMTCLVRLANRYIDEVRARTQRDDYEQVAAAVLGIFERMNARRDG
jgi:hypothetical protein